MLRVAGEAEAEIDGLADALRQGAVDLDTARALAQGFVAARKRVVPDPVGLFAEDTSRRLTRAFGGPLAPTYRSTSRK